MKRYIFDFGLILSGSFLRYFIEQMFVKPIMRPIMRFLRRLDPLILQPFHHYAHHEGKLADCEHGLCKVI